MPTCYRQKMSLVKREYNQIWLRKAYLEDARSDFRFAVLAEYRKPL